MADVELLPLPELPRQVEGYNSDYWEAGQIEEYAADYARACVEANLAPLQAEIERLRAEVERLRADRDSWEQQASDRVADWHAEHLRAERLTEALEEIRSCSTMNLAMQPDPSALTARLGDIHQIACAALAQEDDQ